MPKGFSDKEKTLIKEALIDKGRILFGTYGLKKTSISDITRATGIAQGSFYSFFNSKEELYFEILEFEEKSMKERLFSELKPLENHPRQYLKQLLSRSLEMIENYPIMEQLYLENTMDILLRKLPEEKLDKHFNQDHADFLPIIERWQSQGILRRVEPEIITSLVRSLLFLSLHKKEIGETLYSDTMVLLIDLVSDGLVLKGD